MRTFLDFQKEVARYYDLAAEITEAPDGADVEMIKSSLNQANATRVSENHWKFRLSREFTLTTSSGTQDYIIPHANWGKLRYMWNSTDKLFASETPLRNVPTTFIDFNQSSGSGQQDGFEIFNDASPVYTQPSVPSVLTVNNGSEPTAPSVYIEGTDSTGADVSETILASATGSVVFATVTYYAKTADFNTTMSLMAGADTLVSLGTDEYAKAYPVMHFLSIPVTGKTFNYQFYKKPRYMVRDFDIPDLPYPHSNILVYDTLLDLATFNELDSESVGIWREKQQKLLENLYLEALVGDSVGATGMTINAT